MPGCCVGAQKGMVGGTLWENFLLHLAQWSLGIRCTRFVPGLCGSACRSNESYIIYTHPYCVGSEELANDAWPGTEERMKAKTVGA